MSYILGIDTSSVELGVGLADERRLVAGVSRYLRNSHAEQIGSSVDFLLESSGLKPFDIGHVAIAQGPGSFTGLRIGISFLKGFCFGRDVKVLAVSSLESLAAAWNNRQKPVAVAFDCRNDEIFYARFEYEAGRMVRRSEDCMIPAEKFIAAADNDDIVVTDTLGYEKSAAFSFLKGRPGHFAVEDFPVQRGLACARLGMLALPDAARWTCAAQVLPRYLSASSAEKKRAGKA